MNIYLNGEQREITDLHTIAHLVEDLGLGDKRIAIELNQEIIPRSLYTEHSLSEGDKVEVVTAIGGG